MQHIQGFVAITQFRVNTPGTNSPVGELSDWSRTYSKEKGEYRDADVSGYELTTFRVVDSVTGAAQVLTGQQAKEILEVVRDVIAYATSHISPYDPVDFRNVVLSHFFGRISDLVLGELVDVGSISVPEFVNWNSTTFGNSIRIWLADASFMQQYSDYDITVIPPVEPLSRLMGTYVDGVAAISERTIPMLGDIVQEKKDIHPETYVRFLEFQYVNKNNPAQSTTSVWPVLIYGKNGDQVDAIKDAIVAYLLSNSNYTRNEWEVVLPEIFKRTEFVIFPRFDLEAVPNFTQLSGLYSSFVDAQECIDFAAEATPFYDEAFVRANTSILPVPYKTLMLLAVNGESNISSKATLKSLYPDYLPVSSLSADFSRMQVKTREWVLFMDRLIQVAEKATEISSIPNDMRRTSRDGVLFVSSMHDSVNYLVAAGSNTFYTED